MSKDVGNTLISSLQAQSEEIEPQRLLLDAGNLRLLEYAPDELLNCPANEIATIPVQKRLLDIFKASPRLNVSALEKSIASIGFLKNDKLIVARYDGTRFLVLEGNRRLSAVKSLLENKKIQLSSATLATLSTLSCLVLDGDPISGSEVLLAEYRNNALSYIGIRHITGIEPWEPASRYEFISRLIDSQTLSPEQIADKFGQTISEVMRDYRAHALYKLFRDFEESKNLKKHQLTFNAFAEASRSPHVRDWLGWSDVTRNFANADNINKFFEYVSKQLRIPKEENEEDYEKPEASSESIVRKFRDMLKRGDPEIQGSLESGAFEKAHELFELRKQGKLAQRLKSYISGLDSASVSEITEDRLEVARLLEVLADKANKVREIVQKI